MHYELNFLRGRNLKYDNTRRVALCRLTRLIDFKIIDGSNWGGLPQHQTDLGLGRNIFLTIAAKLLALVTKVIKYELIYIKRSAINIHNIFP